MEKTTNKTKQLPQQDIFIKEVKAKFREITVGSAKEIMIIVGFLALFQAFVLSGAYYDFVSEGALIESSTPENFFSSLFAKSIPLLLGIVVSLATIYSVLKLKDSVFNFLFRVCKFVIPTCVGAIIGTVSLLLLKLTLSDTNTSISYLEITAITINYALVLAFTSLSFIFSIGMRHNKNKDTNTKRWVSGISFLLSIIGLFCTKADDWVIRTMWIVGFLCVFVIVIERFKNGRDAELTNSIDDSFLGLLGLIIYCMLFAYLTYAASNYSYDTKELLCMTFDIFKADCR